MPDQRDWASLLLRHGYSGVKKIGEGSFGVAVLVQDTEGTKAVCKLVDVSKASPKETQEARREARLLSQVKHPYVVRYRENFADRGWLAIIMDYCDGGDIAAQVQAAAKRHVKLDEQKQVLRWFTQSTLALKYLHSKHILHRDLKPSNIFLTKAGDVRMGDFGTSKLMSHTAALAKTFVGTPYYISPEVISEKPYSWPADIWSMGCILYQLCALKVPFDATNITQLAQKICGSKTPVIPDGYSPELREVCQAMMSRKASERPSCDVIIDKQVIQDVVRALLNEARKPETPKVRHEILDQFQLFDRNGDGVIDRRELGTVLKHLDASVWTDDTVDQVLTVADTNKDGKIQFEEFLVWAFGGNESKAVVEKVEALIKAVDTATGDGDFNRLSEAILEWRQAVDVGCLRVSPPQVCVRACEALSWTAVWARDLLENHEDATASFQAVRQMRAILLAVEQLVDECSRQHVQRVGGIATRSAVRGICFELTDGTRQGLCPSGLNDFALESAGVRWLRLDEGERILEVSGLAANARSASRRPSPAPLERRGSRAGAPQSPAPAPAEAKGEESLAGSIVLRTNFGRVLEFGTKTGKGEAFSFQAPEGSEIEDVKFSSKTCTGIRTAPIVVSWPKGKVREVRAAFKPAASAVWSVLLSLGFRVSPQRGKFALLEARRLDLENISVPTELEEHEQCVCDDGEPPSHWDKSLMQGELGPDVQVAKVELGTLELAQLQGVLKASYASPQLPSEGIALAPKGIEIVKGCRLQNWQAWSRFVARREEIREQLAELRAAAGSEPESSLGSRNVGQIACAGDPELAPQLDSLGIKVDKETNVTWLFHGITVSATEDITSPDFDIARAGPEDGRLYGRGCYFSEWSSKIDQLFTPDGAEGLRCMLLCRVTLGHVLTDSAVLPEYVHLVDQCTSGSYHSVLGDRRELCPGSTRDFVVYDKDQVYPEFLLWYRRVYR